MNCSRTENIDLTTTARIKLHDATIVIVPSYPDEYYAYRITAADRSYALRFTNPKRRQSFFAWRAVVREQLGSADILYDAVGAPFVADSDIQIGVSHTDLIAAVIFSNHKCAIDIERRNRDFSRALARFISNDERSLPQGTHPDFNAVIWCAKETLYKISGRRELDLLHDIRITSVDFNNRTVLGAFRSSEESNNSNESEGWTSLEMAIFYAENIIGVYAIKREKREENS